jgi:hypothetical protein
VKAIIHIRKIPTMYGARTRTELESSFNVSLRSQRSASHQLRNAMKPLPAKTLKMMRKRRSVKLTSRSAKQTISIKHLHLENIEGGLKTNFLAPQTFVMTWKDSLIKR